MADECRHAEQVRDVKPSARGCEECPVIEGYDPPEGWGWCFVDEIFLDLSDRQTPQDGPIPRFY